MVQHSSTAISPKMWFMLDLSEEALKILIDPQQNLYLVKRSFHKQQTWQIFTDLVSARWFFLKFQINFLRDILAIYFPAIGCNFIENSVFRNKQYIEVSCNPEGNLSCVKCHIYTYMLIPMLMSMPRWRCPDF